jgi:hypothetical protein
VLQPKWDALGARWHCLLLAYRFLPNSERLGLQNAIVDRLHQVAAEPKKILGKAVQCQKLLSLSRGGKPTHVTFPLARRFVRDFGSVVRINLVDVIHRRHDRPMSGVIASEFIGDEPPWFAPLTF